MYNKFNLGDEFYVCNISNYADNVLEAATCLIGGISLPEVSTLQSREYCITKAQKSYVATKNNREKKSK